MSEERDQVRLDDWLRGEAERMTERIAVIESSAAYDGEIIAAVEVRKAVCDMLESYSTLLVALSQHPNIRNLP
jgi:hypothetical protein